MMASSLLEELAREKAGQRPEWGVYLWEAVPEAKGSLLTGAVAPPLKSGPRKGKPNWRAKDKATERRVFISKDEFVAYKLKWEQETGKCSTCEGSGKRIASSSRTEGNTYKDCHACKGTGKAKGATT